MQKVAESPDLAVTCHASVFFSVNGRNDGTKAVITISYQYPAKSAVYRQAVEEEINRDPSLLQSSMPVQFSKLIVGPFIHYPQLSATGRVLIIIDGLAECDNPLAQQELLRLISEFCIQYPSSPIVWLIASRPEPHITSFFSRRNVIPAYEKEEISVNSDEARADVERYLRDGLTEIKEAFVDTLDPEWPEERDLWKLAKAAGGLFAYAQTAIKYIGDSAVGSPASQLSDVLNITISHSMTNISREEHPLASLDALYARILLNVPPKIMTNTRKILLALASDWDRFISETSSFVLLCNWLGMTADEAYAALNHLRSVMRVPKRDQAHEEEPWPFHKSFIDFISDFIRSGLFPDMKEEAQEMNAKCAFKILAEAPNGVDFGDVSYGLPFFGTLARGPGNGDKISLSWKADKRCGWRDDEMRLKMYKLAVGEVSAGVERGYPSFQDDSCVRLLVTRFRRYAGYFPHHELRDLVFGESRRDEFITSGTIKTMPLSALDAATMIFKVKTRFSRPDTPSTNLSDPCNPSCTHQRQGEWKERKGHDWVTAFHRNSSSWNYSSALDCDFCFSRLERHLETLNVRYPDLTVLALFTSTGDYCAEFKFVDLEDGMSEWTYWIWYRLNDHQSIDQR